VTALTLSDEHAVYLCADANAKHSRNRHPVLYPDAGRQLRRTSGVGKATQPVRTDPRRLLLCRIAPDIVTIGTATM
jgi:hypothetical protein